MQTLMSPPQSAVSVAGNMAPVGPASLGAEQISDLLKRLAEPFDPSLISWVVTATAQGKNGKRGLLAAYADPRAYLDRLNELFTPSGWTQEYSFQVVDNVERAARDGKKFLCPKVMVCCRLTIFGIGVHSGTGEQWSDDDNAVTSSDAQAFKRACVSFGLGRYLYDIPHAWVDLDEHNRPMTTPQLPAGGGKQNGRGKGAQAPASPKTNGSNGHATGAQRHAAGVNPNGSAPSNGGKTHEVIRDQIQKLSKSVGRGISRNTLMAVAGTENLAQVTDAGKLKAILMRLENAERGVARLKAAAAKAGLEAHQTVCGELKLVSVFTDDIPDTKVLQQLLERLERLAGRPPAGRQPSSVGTSGNGSAAAGSKPEPATDFNALRNEVLSLARHLATVSKQPIGDVIAWASDRGFQYSEIGKLGTTDLPKLEVAVRRLREANNPDHKEKAR
jgi:hypothetical protein